jgi:hypothetical protein
MCITGWPGAASGHSVYNGSLSTWRVLAAFVLDVSHCSSGKWVPWGTGPRCPRDELPNDH